MSRHEILVVRLPESEIHPNADALELYTIGGYQVAARKGDFQPGSLAVYIPPDYVVPPRPEYEFLGEHRRIKVRKLRGVYSQGLLMAAPDGVVEGQDVMAMLGITRWEPPIELEHGDARQGPPLMAPVYDVENYLKYGSEIFRPGETVIIQEKLHGANLRVVWSTQENELFVGSRTQWKRSDSKNLWWDAVGLAPWVGELAHDNPDVVFYGEVYGQVQDLRYNGGLNIRLFDAFDGIGTGGWWGIDDFGVDIPNEGYPPFLLYKEPLPDMWKLWELAEGDSMIPGANHCREGIVIRSVIPRVRPDGVRSVLKLVSRRYLERK